MSDLVKKGMDGLLNLMSGLGTSRSKRSGNCFIQDAQLNQNEMTAAYQTNWIARKIVDIPAEDMVREWRDIKSKDAEEIRAQEDALMMPQAVSEAMSWARLYGGGAILMVTNQDLTKPLNVNAIKKGDLERLIVFDRYELSAGELNTWDVLAPNYLKPDSYRISNGQQNVHWSHFAFFHGAQLPRRLMANTQGWGDSELRKCLEDIKDTVAAKDGIAELMQEANVDVIMRQGLNDELATDQESAILKRYEAFGIGKSNVHLALLDGDEQFERKTLQLSGVAPILETFQTWISGCAGIPLTKIFGTSAKGMNATGEGDERNYYDALRSGQVTKLEPGVRAIDEVMVRSALGTMPEDYDWAWNPLAQQSQIETAQSNQLQAQTDQMYLDMGVVKQSQIQRNLQSQEQYQFEDDEITEQENAESDFFSGEDVDLEDGSADQ